MSDAYAASLDYLYGRLNYERVGMPRSTSELRLERMRRLLKALGDPQRALRIVHVAGTKGKGSTAALLAAALTGSGLRTGLFCSPHLHHLEERFQIDGRPIAPEGLVELVDAVRPAVAEIDDGRGATFFEITTAMGLLHFARAGTGMVVLEVGMGGRFDSTNVVRPEVSVITSISLDHTRQLGSTLGAIAREKAGIIKRGRPAVSGAMAGEAVFVLEAIAAARRSRLYQVGRDFTWAYQAPERPVVRPSPGHVRVQTWARDWGSLTVPLLGEHQALNVATAIATLDVLSERGLEIGPEAVTRSWARLSVPVRVEVLGHAPWLIVDGAHNVASAAALAETLRSNLPDVPRALVFGTTRDKDVRGQLRVLLPLFQRVIATRYIENPRAVPVDEIASIVRELGFTGHLQRASEPAEALDRARELTARDGLICVTGSMFLAAECRALVLGVERAPEIGAGVP